MRPLFTWRAEALWVKKLEEHEFAVFWHKRYIRVFKILLLLLCVPLMWGTSTQKCSILQENLPIGQNLKGKAAAVTFHGGLVYSVKIRRLDPRSQGRWFHSRSGHYQVITTWISDCLQLQTGKASRYITNTKVNSAFYPSGVDKSSTGLSDKCWGGARSSLPGGRFHMASDAP